MVEKQKKILIIDDEKDLAAMVSLRLRTNGFSVTEAFSIEEGLKRIGEEKPDLILLDVVLPDGNGYQLCQRLKSNPQTKDIAIIILTASTQGDLTKKAVEAGAEDYSIKPFEPKDLLEKINKALEKR
jgi:DNA-binding response OmpR family regulator